MKQNITYSRQYAPKVGEDAGKAFAEGGFGCVFRPQLACKNIPYKKNDGVSKLMKKANQQSELKEFARIRSIVKEIKNYNDYFLIDGVYGCTPAPLSPRDKVDFDIKCKNLAKKGFRKDNINSKLNNLGLINLPYGGVSVDKHLESWQTMKNSRKKTKEFSDTNKALILLLTKGIIPLNKKSYLHMDVKGPNILYNVDKTGRTRCKLIDWGLAVDYKKTSIKKTPHIIYNGPLQYNTPFSVILFSDDVNEVIKEFMNNKGFVASDIKSIDRASFMHSLAMHLLQESLESIGRGHFSYIISQLKIIFEKGSDFGEYIIVSYLATILDKYVNDAVHFEEARYFHEVFSKNVDVWGLIMAYYDAISIPQSHRDITRMNIIKIIKKYCYSTTYAADPIPIEKLVNDLSKL